MLYHMIAFTAGVILDLIIGDPHKMPHPIRLIGHMISALERGLRNPEHTAKKKRLHGLLLWVLVILFTVAATLALLLIAYFIHPAAGIVAEACLTAYTLAATSLRRESMKVFYALQNHDLPGARRAVSMIVGRDTDCLDTAGVTKAAVETVAENTSDGVIAPLLYCCIGGPVLGMAYKAVNTMDSMLGYHNEKYEDFGFFPAKFDDIFNYIPARLSALFMMSAAFLCPSFDGKGALRIYKRDRRNHKSPNSAQTESVCAGALQIRLAGNASYFGKMVEKPFIGDDIKSPEPEDIKRANLLMFCTATFAFIIYELVLLIFTFV